MVRWSGVVGSGAAAGYAIRRVPAAIREAKVGSFSLVPIVRFRETWDKLPVAPKWAETWAFLAFVSYGLGMLKNKSYR